MTNVIVIDDQPLEGQMIGFVLKRDCPYVFYAGQAYNAESGVELARTKKADIIFLDITMPGMDGIEAIEKIKEKCPKCSIVMLTAHDDFDHIRRAMRAGANDYLLKPTRPKDILEAVSRWSEEKMKQHQNPIEEAKKYVEEHMEESISLTNVAEHLFLSPAYLSRMFRQETGDTFSAWISQRRVMRASVLLSETTLSVSDIAAKVGFKEANSFTRLFKQSTGLSPTEFRKNNQSGEKI